MKISPLLLSALLLTGCSYNPLSGNNHLTGSGATATASAAGSGTVTRHLGASKPLAGAIALLGGAVGYYATTQRFEAGGIVQAGGQVYQVGQYVGIEMPTDRLFEPNSAELLPSAPFILDSAATVLQRTPNHHLLVSGNSSGFHHAKWEQTLAEKRAKRVSAYLFKAGLNRFNDEGLGSRRLQYVGYGDYFPIANRITHKGIRTNSRIQITAYPTCADLHLDSRSQAMHNFSGLKQAS